MLAAMVGLSFHSVTTFSVGVFMEPLNLEFGWNRAQISVGLTIAALSTIPLSPLIGALIDRWGTRILAIPGLILTALALASFGLANGSMTQWLALWSFYALAALLVKSTVWTAAVSGVFSAGRGLALGVMLSGSALGQILAPPLTYWLIESFGWRQAYLWLAIGWGGPALILVILFLRDAYDRNRREAAASPEAAAARPALLGLGVREAIRSPALLRIAASTLITTLLGFGIIVHIVPILTEAGVARSSAAYLASLAGVAGIFGKLATGWFMDRRDAGMIGGLTLSVATIGFVLLLEQFRTPAVIVLAMLIIGYTTGAKLQITAYLTSRYGGMRNFGKIFGVMASLIAVGAGVGPVVAGAVYDIYGSYTPLLLVAIPGSLLSGLLIIGLGSYPKWTSATAPAAPRPAE